MKTISKITISLAAVALLFVGCSDDKKASHSEQNVAKEVKKTVIKTVSEESLGLRKTDLYSESDNTQGHKAAYSTEYTGSGHKIKRAFQDAPPMIPHDTEGMLPVKINDNQCLGCHMPQAAKDGGMGATPIPVSHITNFRPTTAISNDGQITKNGHVIDNTSSETQKNVSIKKTEKNKLYGGRFNCTQCHAPQSGEDLAVENTFKAEYTSKDGANKSSWSGSKLMEGIDTTK